MKSNGLQKRTLKAWIGLLTAFCVAVFSMTAVLHHHGFEERSKAAHGTRAGDDCGLCQGRQQLASGGLETPLCLFLPDYLRVRNSVSSEAPFTAFTGSPLSSRAPPVAASL